MLAIIQARSNSKRFKNKVLKLINNIPLIVHVKNRVAKSKLVKKVIVSTSRNKTDNNLVKILKLYKITFFRGELVNVSKRLLETSKKYKSKYFIRINGDSPLIDFRIINRAIKIHRNRKSDYDIITNVFPRTFPKGQSVEIIKSSILQNNMRKFSKLDKEHVTTYFYKNHLDFNIKNFKSYKSVKKEVNQVVDYPADLKLVTKMFNNKL